jgi:hypothetical protein
MNSGVRGGFKNFGSSPNRVGKNELQSCKNINSAKDLEVVTNFQKVL